MKTILITGASGFIATNFIKQYTKQYKFIQLSHVTTQGHITFADLKANPTILSRVDVILNLAGANIGAKRWSRSRKIELLKSIIYK